MRVFDIEDIEEFIDYVCSTGSVPMNNILTGEEELKAEDKANKSDKAVRKYIIKCVENLEL